MKKYNWIFAFVCAFLIVNVFVQFNCKKEEKDSFKTIEIATKIPQELIEKTDFFDQNCSIVSYCQKRSFFSSVPLLALYLVFLLSKDLVFFERTYCNHSLNKDLSCNFLRLQILKSKAHPPTYFSS